MTELVELAVSHLLASDVGSRIVLAQEGVAFDGTLTCMNVTRSDYAFKDRPRVTAQVTAKVIELDGSRDKTLAEVKIDNLPLDYRVQIDRETKEQER